jgi:hypothetical protein
MSLWWQSSLTSNAIPGIPEAVVTNSLKWGGEFQNDLPTGRSPSARPGGTATLYPLVGDSS